MPYDISYQHAISNHGNWDRMKKLMKRAEKGDTIVIGFIGGSITQGSLSSSPLTCYAHRVYEWWKKTFKKSSFKYVNAGIGGTTSEYGCARVDSDLLSERPDFVIVEFSVNDESNEHFCETYESLVRRIYYADNAPAVLLVHNVFYNNGASAQMMHGKTARHYDIPAVSMQSTIYPRVLSGRIPNREITPDDLHPNDEGHELVASVIVCFLEKVRKYRNQVQKEDAKSQLMSAAKNPFTANGYEHSTRYQVSNTRPQLNGFCEDKSAQKDLADCFKNGWTGRCVGDSAVFEIEAASIGIAYRRTKDLPAPVASVVIDGDTEHAQILDANFDETWGDKLELKTILEHGKHKIHRVEIKIIESHKEDRKPFYLVSVIGSY